MYAAVSVASVVVFGVVLILSLLSITGRIRVPGRVMDALLVAGFFFIAAAFVSALLAVLL